MQREASYDALIRCRIQKLLHITCSALQVAALGIAESGSFKEPRASSQPRDGRNRNREALTGLNPTSFKRAHFVEQFFCNVSHHINGAPAWRALTASVRRLCGQQASVPMLTVCPVLAERPSLPIKKKKPGHTEPI